MENFLASKKVKGFTFGVNGVTSIDDGIHSSFKITITSPECEEVRGALRVDKDDPCFKKAGIPSIAGVSFPKCSTECAAKLVLTTAEAHNVEGAIELSLLGFPLAYKKKGDEFFTTEMFEC